MFGKIAIVFVALACVGSAQTAKSRPGKGMVIWSPPEIDLFDRLPPATVPRMMISSLKVAGIPIVLEESKLEDVQKQFGGTIGDHGDAGDSLAWLCFHGDDGSGPWIFWLTSGEMGGLSVIDGFRWSRLAPDERPDNRCRLLPRENNKIELPFALHLGLTGQEIQKILGQPTLVRRNFLLFEHEHPTVIRKDPYTVLNTLVVVLQDNRVQTIDVYKSTMN